MSFSSNKRNSNEFEFYRINKDKEQQKPQIAFREPVKPKTARRSYKNPLRGLVTILFACAMVFNLTHINLWDYILSTKFNNRNINLKIDRSFFNKEEEPFLNDIMFDSPFVDSVNTQKPLMNSLFMGKELNQLKGSLEALAASYPRLNPGIFVWDYSTGNYVSINGDKEYSTASIIKLPVLVQLFRRIEQGLVSTNEIFQMTTYYRTGGSGKLQFLSDQSEFDVDTLAKVMIQQSDNTATNMLLSSIGGSNELNRSLRSWGFAKTHMANWLPDLNGENVSTPQDLATILFNIDNPDFLSLKSRAKIVEIMSHVKNRNLIQKGLPEGVKFIHKTGDIGEMQGDAGIVMMPNGRKYIVVIMVKRPWNDYSSMTFINEASTRIYNALAYN